MEAFNIALAGSAAGCAAVVSIILGARAIDAGGGFWAYLSVLLPLVVIGAAALSVI